MPSRKTPRRGMARGLIVSALAALAAVPSAASAAGAGAMLRGLPAGAARAALDPEPTLPAPRGWSWRDGFSRTSGTGRLIHGAFEWSDWVYDAWGAAGTQGLPQNSTMEANANVAPTHGDYMYPSGAAGNDGADIFRAGVGLTRTSSVWRVDWNTLADPSIPIAEWTFDTDDNARTGGSVWPASANVISPGIEKALVVSARGARLIDVVTGKTLTSFPTSVDAGARSILVRIPRSILRVTGRWRIRLAAGLSDSSGAAFAVPALGDGLPAASGAPRIYNITFRTAAQEPAVFTDGQTDKLISETRQQLNGTPLLGVWGAGEGLTVLVLGNFWSENDQADTLATGDVSKFSAVVRWSQLAARRTTAAPVVHGYSDRWYVTDQKLGQGMNASPEANPSFLGRVQPYAVYVPRNYTGRRPLPLTWILHSLNSSYNQYGAADPRQIQEECEQRDSICASPEGFGPAGDWSGIAEHDFWQVWRQMALDFAIAPNRTVLSGYSMGGLGSFDLGMTYPSDFSEAMPLDGGGDETGTDCGVVRTANARWEPYVMSAAVFDELAPHEETATEAASFAADAQRFHFFTTTVPEHLATAAMDGFSAQIAALGGSPAAPAAPETVDYTWCSSVEHPTLGLGPTSVYWLSGLAQRSTSSASHVVADDAAIPAPAETEQLSTTLIDPPDAPPMHVLAGGWAPGTTPRSTRALTLMVTNTSAATVDAAAARLRHGSATVGDDGAGTLRLINLAPGTTVRYAAGATAANADGTASVPLRGGTTKISW